MKNDSIFNCQLDLFGLKNTVHYMCGLDFNTLKKIAGKVISKKKKVISIGSMEL